GLLDSRTDVLTSIHIVLQLLMVSGAVLLFAAFQRTALPYMLSVLAAVVVMMFLIMIFRHLIPRIITYRNPEALAVPLFPVVNALDVMLTPISCLLMSGLNYFHREGSDEPAKEEEASEEEIQAVIDAGQEEGILERDEGEMIQSIVPFGDKVAREVM